MSAITAISTQFAIPTLAPASGGAATPGDFQSLFSTSIQTVESQGAQSRQAVQQFLSGDSDDVHKVAIAAQRAELSSELFMQMRNKVISAYQEIMKMQM
jgi:flagellar hook-basal body complex protein FliE